MVNDGVLAEAGRQGAESLTPVVDKAALPELVAEILEGRNDGWLPANDLEQVVGMLVENDRAELTVAHRENHGFKRIGRTLESDPAEVGLSTFLFGLASGELAERYRPCDVYPQGK